MENRLGWISHRRLGHRPRLTPRCRDYRLSTIECKESAARRSSRSSIDISDRRWAENRAPSSRRLGDGKGARDGAGAGAPGSVGGGRRIDAGWGAGAGWGVGWSTGFSARAGAGAAVAHLSTWRAQLSWSPATGHEQNGHSASAFQGIASVLTESHTQPHARKNTHRHI